MGDVQVRPDRIRRIMIVDPEQFRLPMVCVVCGNPVAACVSYEQDHVPVPIPMVGVSVIMTQTTQLSIPYCERHARRFRRRWRILRVLQPIAYVVVVIAAIAGRLLESVPLYAVAGGGFLFLVASIFVIKPFLYDVFFKLTQQRIYIRGGGQEFLEQVLEANPGNAVAR